MSKSLYVHSGVMYRWTILVFTSKTTVPFGFSLVNTFYDGAWNPLAVPSEAISSRESTSKCLNLGACSSTLSGPIFVYLRKKFFTSVDANKSESCRAVALVAATTWTKRTVNKGASRGSSLFSQVHCPQQHIIAFKNSTLPKPLMTSRGSKSYPQLI
jgi:hypothetical protein